MDAMSLSAIQSDFNITVFFKTCTEFGRGEGGGTKSRVHVSAVVSLRSPRFLTCNSLSLDVHQFFPRLHFNRLCFPERRLVIENTNLLLQTSVSVCVCCFHFGEKIDITLTRSKGCVFHMASLYRCVCVCVRQEREVQSLTTGQNSKWR